MYLFLATAVPVSYFVVFSVAFGEFLPENGVARPFFRGTAWFVLAYLFSLVLGAVFPLRYTNAGIYLHFFFHHTFYYGLFALVGAIPFMVVARNRGDSGGLREYYAFFSGFFLFIGVVDVIVFRQGMNPYVLFMLPLVRVGLCLSLAATLALTGRYGRWAWYVLCPFGVVVTSVAALTPLFYHTNRVLEAWTALAANLALSTALFAFARRD